MVTYEEIIENNADFADKITPILSSGRPTGYDIVVLTNSWQLTELVKNGWLVPLDHSQLGNFATYASPLVKSPAYDPGNKYTVAWQSGFTGIAYDPSKTKRKITSIHDLWDPAFKGRVGMMTDLNDFGSAGLLYVGADVTNSTEDDWHRRGRRSRLRRTPASSAATTTSTTSMRSRAARSGSRRPGRATSSRPGPAATRTSSSWCRRRASCTGRTT